jgi:hypothetical protein
MASTTQPSSAAEVSTQAEMLRTRLALGTDPAVIAYELRSLADPWARVPEAREAWDYIAAILEGRSTQTLTSALAHLVDELPQPPSPAPAVHIPNPTTTKLVTALTRFTPDRLSTDWRPGPPYALPPEVDAERTLNMAQRGHRVRINRTVLSPEALRNPRTRMMWAFAPQSDFRRTNVVDGVEHIDPLGDVMISMTGLANPEDLRLSSFSPNYAAEWLRANLPEGRVQFELPDTMGEFQAAVVRDRPDLLMLSGLNVNTRALLQMALFARQNGVQEVWLGGDAAIAPYRIMDTAFDRVIWGPGEEYLHQQLVGDEPLEHRHPRAEQMLAGVDWVMAGADGGRNRVRFNTVHMALRLGCTQKCLYCAEGIKSARGRAQPATTFEQARDFVDQALSIGERGIRRAYFVDPDFGRLWDDAVEGELLRYMAERGMGWSTLTNVRTLQQHGDFMADHGLTSNYLGIESLAPTHKTEGPGRNTLKALQRGWQDQDETVRQVQRMAKRGVMTFGLYILGNPGETLEAAWEGIQRLKGVVPLSQISTNQPFPGTREFVMGVRDGLIHDFDPDGVRYGRMVWAPGGQVIDPNEMGRMHLAAHQEVNNLERPGGFLELQQQMRSVRTLDSSSRSSPRGPSGPRGLGRGRHR